MTDLDHRVLERPPRRHDLEWIPRGRNAGRGRAGRRLLGLGALLVLLGGLAIGGLLFATPTTLLVVPYLFAMLRKRNDGKPAQGVFAEEL
jgi:hypothetical protein